MTNITVTSTTLSPPVALRKTRISLENGTVITQADGLAGYWSISGSYLLASNYIPWGLSVISDIATISGGDVKMNLGVIRAGTPDDPSAGSDTTFFINQFAIESGGSATDTGLDKHVRQRTIYEGVTFRDVWQGAPLGVNEPLYIRWELTADADATIIAGNDIIVETSFLTDVIVTDPVGGYYY